MKTIYKSLYRVLASVGRRIGGIRPFRVMNSLRQLAWADPPRASEFRWVRDCWGAQLRLHPFYLIDHHIISQGTYDKTLHRFIARNVLPGMTVLDIGANIGSVTAHFAMAVGSSGRVIAFEPVSGIRARLMENVVRNGLEWVTAEALGVWKSCGEVEINVSKVNSENHGRSTLSSHSGGMDTETIATVTLDSYCEERNIKSIDIIKMDIQGAEFSALEGAESILRQMRPILLTEVSPSDLREFGASSKQYLQKIEKLGYSCHKITRNGMTGDRLDAAKVGDDAHFSNVVCIPAGSVG